MEEGEFNFLKNNRKLLRAKITRLTNTIPSQVEGFDVKQCNNTIADLSDFKSKIESANLQLAKGIWKFLSSDDERKTEFEKCEEYDHKIVTSVRLVQEQLDSLSRPFAPAALQSNQVSDLSRIGQQLKLP